MPMDSANAASAASPRKASSLFQRVASAAVVLPILVALIWLGYWPVLALVVLAVVLSLSELYAALAQGGYRPRTLVGIACGLLFCAAAALRAPLGVDLVGLALVAGIGITLTAELLRRDREGGLLAWALTFSGACYVGWLFSHYILLQSLKTPLVPGAWLAALHISSGTAWIYTVLAITWCQDTGAYFAGRTFGRHQMAPYLSPKKTWEGAIGGELGALLAALVAVPLLGLPISYSGAALLGLLGGVMGLVGDLSESFIKRQVHIKDAGALIPGHGG